MAVQIIVRKIDDLDGTSSDDVSTVHFGLDGIRYEIDLHPAHADALRGVMAEFVESARRVEEPSGGMPHVGRKELPSLIRNWARENGFNLCGRGRIPTAAIVAYKFAHEDCLEDVTQMCDDLLVDGLG